MMNETETSFTQSRGLRKALKQLGREIVDYIVYFLSMPPLEGKACKTCINWIDTDEYCPIMHPRDPDTYEEMYMPFKVRKCKSKELLFFERPLSNKGFAVVDGSEYMAELYTAENFYCPNHKAAPIENPN
jgi:hypothetical protein